MIELPPRESRTSSQPDALAAEQARQNRTTRNQWQIYASHRRSLERLIVPQRPGAQTICVLGAGNCNDLDLKWLVGSYREVHLVDLDAAALASAVERQGVADESVIRRHAPADLTGVGDRVARWQSTPPDVAEIGSVTRRLLEPVEPPWSRFDVVLSPCVLTQTMNPARDALRNRYPPSQPARVALQEALRLRHLRTIAACIAPGGRAVLAIDLISAEHYRDLARIPQDRLADFMGTFIARGSNYRGLDPASIERACGGDSILRRQVGSPQFTEPWLWHLGLRKTFLVYAATFRSRERGSDRAI